MCAGTVAMGAVPIFGAPPWLLATSGPSSGSILIPSDFSHTVSGYGPAVPGTVGEWENCMAQSYLPVRNSDPLMQSETSENSLGKRFWFTFSFRMAAISLFPAISDDFSVECLRAKSQSSSQTNSVDANFPASLTDSTVLHLPIALTKIELIPIFHAVECDREMAFDSFLSPASIEPSRSPVSSDVRVDMVQTSSVPSNSQ